MDHFQLKTAKLAGFAISSARPGEQVQLLVKDGFTSFDDEFTKYIEQISNAVIVPSGRRVESIENFVVLIHENDVADVYFDVPIVGIAHLKDGVTIQKGQPVFLHDIDRIGSIEFEGLEIKASDAVVHFSRVGWRSLLYFDFTRKIDVAVLARELGELRHETFFRNIILKTTQEIKEATMPLIITEGKTDWRHLKEAYKALGVELRCKFQEYEDDRGDMDTLRMCKNLARVEQMCPVIFIFDHDNSRIIKELDAKTDDGELYQRWGNNVYSFYLPKPSHREEYKYISIEFYYKDKEITQVDKDGRRLHFTNELNKEVHPDNSHKQIETTPDTKLEYEKKIADKDAHLIEDAQGRPTGISKAAFVDKIIAREKGFDSFDFSEFTKIYHIVGEIAKEAAT